MNVKYNMLATEYQPITMPALHHCTKIWFVAVCLGSSFLVTDFCYLASCHSASVFQSGGFWWTAGDWMDDLAQICFGTEWISRADDASWCPACLAMPTALHMCKGTTGCENRRPGSPHHSKPLCLSPLHSVVSKEEGGKVNNCLYLQRSSKSAPLNATLWQRDCEGTHTCSLTSLCCNLHSFLSCIIKSDKPGSGLAGTHKAVCLHYSGEAWASPGEQMCCSHLLWSTCHHSGGKPGEVRRCNWITEGTQQCGKRKWEEIREVWGIRRKSKKKKTNRDIETGRVKEIPPLRVRE